MKRILSSCAVLGGLLFSGCASVTFCDKGGHTVVDITNTGWYLLNFIPLASGNPERPNANECRLFSQTVTLENNMKMLDYALRKRGAKTYKNVISYTTDANVMVILFKRHVCHTSAELIFEEPHQEPKLPCELLNQ